METRFSLWFEGDGFPELVKTSFQHRLIEGRIDCVRGKTSGAYPGRGTFQWTPGVQALSILAVRSAAGENSQLSGVDRSPAASLDYALGKPPLWLHEMFGWDAWGEPLVKKLFRRTNPERKRPGPVSVSFSHRELSESNFRIFVNGSELADHVALDCLASKIERSWRTSKALSSKGLPEPKRRTAPRISLEPLVKKLFYSEVFQMFNHTDIFNRRFVKNRISGLLENPSFTTLATEHLSLLEEMPLAEDTSSRLGIAPPEALRNALCQDEPIYFAIPATQPTVLALLFYLKYTKGYHIEINYQFGYAVELIEKIIAGEFETMPDVCTAGIGPSAILLSHHRTAGYTPQMFMPDLSHRIVAPRNSRSQEINDGEYFFVTDNPTTGSFYFDHLIRTKSISAKRINTHHMEPDEVFSLLREEGEDIRSVQWFPHYDLNALFNGCTFLDEQSDITRQSTLMFVSEEFRKKRLKLHYLNIAIRDAWLTLKQGGPELDQTLEAIVRDREYIEFFQKWTGLHSLSKDNSLLAVSRREFP